MLYNYICAGQSLSDGTTIVLISRGIVLPNWVGQHEKGAPVGAPSSLAIHFDNPQYL